MRGPDTNAPNVNIINSLMAGSISGMVAKTLVAPLDRVKIIYQVGNDRFTFVDSWNRAKNICKKDGMCAMWRGNSASLVRVVPYAAIQFTVHEQLKSAFNVRTYEQKLQKPILSFLAGALAGFSAVTCTYPLDVARARMATDTTYRHLWDVLSRAIMSRDPKYNLYRGFSAAFLGVVPYTGVSFLIYELFKTRYFSQIKTSKDQISLAVQNIVLGTCVSFLGQTLIYPLDIARRRMQVNLTDNDPNIFGVFRQVFRENGLRGLFTGISLAWLKLPFVVGASMATFDISYYILNKYFP